MTASVEKLNEFLALVDLSADEVRCIQSLVDKIRYEAYDAGRRDEKSIGDL